MSEILKKIDVATFEPWKDVDKFKIFGPELMKGDSATVYLAEEIDTKKLVVVKSYSAQWIFDNQQIIQSELAGFNEFTEKGVTPRLLRKPLRTRNNIYLPMELMNCGSLSQQKAMGKILPIKLIQSAARSVLGFLQVLHSRGVIHRDINPKHILANLGEDGKVTFKLIGMQFMKQIKKGKGNSLVGTLCYNAPETASDLGYSYPADIWSFGLTLFEIVYGALPVSFDPDFLSKVQQQKPITFPLEVACPTALKELITQCLNFVPEARPKIEDLMNHHFLSIESFSAQFSPSSRGVEAVKPQPKDVVDIPVEDSCEENEKLSYSNKDLLKMIHNDFGKYLAYIIKKQGKEHKLKSEIRESLHPYEIKGKSCICKGGFSEIYLCQNKITKEVYAMKIVKSNKMVDVKIANLLLGEIEIMLDIKFSPFTIALIDYFVYRNDLCLVLEYCNGGDMDNYMRRLRRGKTAFPVEEMKLISWNVACGLRDMHAKGMMHRDIKPKNILVVEDKKTGRLLDIKLCDYGLSKKVEENSSLLGSTILGTYDYFAPELYSIMEKKIAGDTREYKYDNKIDVWSYGVLLYFALYGRTPMEPPGSKHKVMKEHIISYPALSDVPESFFDLIKKCLNFDANKLRGNNKWAM